MDEKLNKIKTRRFARNDVCKWIDENITDQSKDDTVYEIYEYASDKFPHLMTTVVVYEPLKGFQNHENNFHISKFTHEQKDADGFPTRDPCKKKLTKRWNIVVELWTHYEEDRSCRYER